MKRWSAILFLFIYILGSTNAFQFLKLPLLVSHYIKHKKESPYITLGSFFKMHYIDPQPMDADYNEDMQLPFKKTPVALCRNMPLFVANQSVIAIHAAPVFDKQPQPVFNDDIPSAFTVNAIFQPPRA
ncbi:MAG TPA: hypothetical protein VF008_02490 [Niastella sp.]